MPKFGNKASILNPHPTASAIARGRTIHPRAYMLAQQKREARIKELRDKIIHQTASRKECREYERISGTPYPANHLTVVQAPARGVALPQRVSRLARPLSLFHKAT